MIRARVGILLLLALSAGCATSGAVRRVETQVTVLRVETARRDSARAAELGRIITLQQRLLDSLVSTQQALLMFRATTNADITDVNRQLMQIQALTGQSQQRLTELRTDIEARNAAMLAAPPVIPPGGDTTAAGLGAPPAPSANQMYQAALMQYRRSALGTARMGFQDFLRAYPTDAQVPDALYFLAETFDEEAPDSAAHYYARVLAEHPRSGRAPRALYKIGLAAEARRDLPAARAAYQRILREFPRSDEAELAQRRLDALRP